MEGHEQFEQMGVWRRDVHGLWSPSGSRSRDALTPWPRDLAQLTEFSKPLCLRL